MVTNVNVVQIVGTITSSYKHCFKHNGRNYFRFFVDVPRKSGVCDNIKIVASDGLVDPSFDDTGKTVCINGKFVSRNNTKSDGRIVLDVYVICDDIKYHDDSGYYDCLETNNYAAIEGVVSKTPNCGTTLKGDRYISTVNILVDDMYQVPLILWGVNAIASADWQKGHRIAVSGRIQSRNKRKTLPNGVVREWTAYELSCSKLREIDDEN